MMGDAVDTDKKKAKKPVELTKKQELNNHIVLMRKVVRTARVHIINKLTKDIKKLKERKGDEKALEKTKRKIERFLQEIQVIKHLGEDKVSIFSLQDKTKLEEVLQNPKASTKDRALTRFSHHKLIQSEVLKYRTHNIYWDLQIPVLLERSKDKRRRINKKLAEREAERAIGKYKTEDDNGKISETETDDDDASSELGAEDDDQAFDEEKLKTGGTLRNGDIDIDIGLAFDKKQNSAKPTKPSKKKTAPQSTQSTKKQTAKQKKDSAKATKSLIKPPEYNISKSIGTVKIQHLKDLADLENSEIVNPPELKVTVDDLTHVPKLRPKSSFFVGGVDEKVEEPKEKERFEKKPRKDFSKNKERTDFKPIFRKGKLINKPPQNFKSASNSQPRRDKNQRHFNSEEVDNSNFMPLGNRSEHKIESHPNPKQAISSTVQSDKLHPSWEAKKRQQLTLSAFKGKKTKFSDDD